MLSSEPSRKVRLSHPSNSTARDRQIRPLRELAGDQPPREGHVDHGRARRRRRRALLSLTDPAVCRTGESRPRNDRSASVLEALLSTLLQWRQRESKGDSRAYVSEAAPSGRAGKRRADRQHACRSPTPIGHQTPSDSRAVGVTRTSTFDQGLLHRTDLRPCTRTPTVGRSHRSAPMGWARSDLLSWGPFMRSYALLVVLAVMSVTALTFVPAADATFAGSNGKISFLSLRPAPGNTATFNIFHVFAMEPDGSAPSLVDYCPGGGPPCAGNRPNRSAAVWSPDGSQLALSTEVGGALYVLNADGSGFTQLAPALNQGTMLPGGVGGQARAPSWSPDGERIAFSACVPDFRGQVQSNLTSTPCAPTALTSHGSRPGPLRPARRGRPTVARSRSQPTARSWPSPLTG